MLPETKKTADVRGQTFLDTVFIFQILDVRGQTFLDTDFIFFVGYL